LGGTHPSCAFDRALADTETGIRTRRSDHYGELTAELLSGKNVRAVIARDRRALAMPCARLRFITAGSAGFC